MREPLISTAQAASPGLATLALSWAGVIETSLSILLLALSIVFLLYRWRVVAKRDRDG